MGARGATETGEVASRSPAWSPPPTSAGGQHDGSYASSFKLDKIELYAEIYWTYKLRTFRVSAFQKLFEECNVYILLEIAGLVKNHVCFIKEHAFPQLGLPEGDITFSRVSVA